MDLMSAGQLLGNFGEFVSSIVVLATVIYLAIQVRQTRLSVQSSSWQNGVNNIIDWNFRLAEDAEQRLTTNIDGKVSYELKHPFGDGTTHILFTPQDFLARLAALVPRPRANLTRYHGVFAPNSPFRRAVVPGSANPAHNKRKKPTTPAPAESAVDRDSPTAPLTWAERLKRVFDIDVSVCPLCGGTLRVIADVTDPDVIQTILAHLKQRAPPHAVRRQTPGQVPQNDLFAAS